MKRGERLSADRLRDRLGYRLWVRLVRRLSDGTWPSQLWSRLLDRLWHRLRVRLGWLQ